MDTLLAKYGSMPREVSKEVTKAVNAGGKMVERTAKKLIKKRSYGNRYKRGTKFHIASVPWQAPNNDNGDLHDNIVTTSVHRSKFHTAFVTSRMEYSKALEYGTRRGLKKRPFMRPALQQNRVKIARMIKDAMNGVIRK